MRQPSGSKIQLKRKANRLELKIPASLRFDRSAIHQLIVTSIMNLVALIPLSLTIYMAIAGIGIALVVLLPLTYVIGKSAWQMSFDFADEFLLNTKIVIDRQQFTLSQHLYNLDRGRPKHLKTTEIGQIIVDSYQHPDFKVPKVSLLIELRQADAVKVLTTGPDLTDRELKWLATELSNWLGVNLVRMDLDLNEL
jgi:hypothetical protein